MSEKLSVIETTACVPVVVEDVSNLPVASLNYENLVSAWMEFLKEYSGVTSAQSERTYRGAIRQLHKYFFERGVNLITATEADVKAWLKYLKGSKANSTVQMYLVAARLFYSFLASKKVITENPCKAGGETLKAGVKVDREKHRRDYLSTEKAKELFENMPAGTEKELRDRAIVSLMCTTGLRCIEVSRALYEDWRTLGNCEVLYIQGKGHDEKDDCVKISPVVSGMIRDYLKVRFNGNEPPNSAYLFVSTSRNHAKLDKDDELSTQAIRAIVKQAMKIIGFDDRRHTAHSLRHTAATLALRTGEKIENVQNVLRHKNIQTTLIYAKALEREKNNAELAVSNLIFGEQTK